MCGNKPSLPACGPLHELQLFTTPYGVVTLLRVVRPRARRKSGAPVGGEGLLGRDVAQGTEPPNLGCCALRAQSSGDTTRDCKVGFAISTVGSTAGYVLLIPQGALWDDLSAQTRAPATATRGAVKASLL